MEDKLKKSFCPSWCPKNIAYCNYECENEDFRNKYAPNFSDSMNTQKLLERLQESAKIFSLRQLKIQLEIESASLCPKGILDSSMLHSVNNVKTMIQLKETEQVDEILPVDENRLKEFEKDLCAYMETYAPNQTKLMTYVLLISIYLTFILKMPLHYTGTKMDDKNEIYFDGEKYRCPVKNQYITDEHSLCRYCVALPYKAKRNTEHAHYNDYLMNEIR